MRDAAYNPNDPEFLASLARDAELTGEAQDRLDTHLRDSEGLRAFVSELGSLDRLIGNWAETEVELDWEAHAALIESRIDGDVDEEALASVDSLLERWGTHTPEVDENRFVTEVTKCVTASRSTKRTRRLIFRIGAPLATAAAVALVATAWLWDRALPQPFVQVSYRMPGDRPADAASTFGTRVRFDRSPRAEVVGEHRAVVAMIAMGSSPLGGAQQEDIPPP